MSRPQMRRNPQHWRQLGDRRGNQLELPQTAHASRQKNKTETA